MAIFVRPIGPGDLAAVTRVLNTSWGGTTVLALGRGRPVDASRLPGHIAFEADGDELAGVVTYDMRDGTVEIITIDAVISGRGVGGLLLDAVREAARALGAGRLSVVTTNDNTHALRFYQRYGFDLIALRRNAVDGLRHLRPAIPATSDGIPIRHELELELRL